MIPLFRTKQIRMADEYAIQKLGIPGIVLMENAAKNIFQEIIESFPELKPSSSKIGIICGKGNNGGDGFALGRHFINNGYPVKIISVGKESELKGDALTNFRITKKIISKSNSSSIRTFKKNDDLIFLEDCEIIIDAILGTGAKGELKEPYNSIIEFINEMNSTKISVDVPTGLDTDTGYGISIFQADLTVTLAELKRGLFFGKGFTHSGEVKKASIGIGAEYFNKLQVDEYLIEPEDAFTCLPSKELDIHKYSAGKVLTIAGSGDLPGAAVFTANSSLYCGAGASILAFPQSLKEFAQVKVNEVVVHDYDDDQKGILSFENISELNEKINWADVIAIGPGLGRNKDTLKAVGEVLNNFPEKKMVIDADAIYGLNKKGDLRNKILTPHHKEFSDLIGVSINELTKDLLEYGKRFVNKTGCYLVLKGAPTLIFNPEGQVLVNSTGNVGMARFGTGDVLTGVIAGFLSQSTDIESPLIAAVYIHSLSADLLFESKTEYGILATDLMRNIPNAIRFIINSFI